MDFQDLPTIHMILWMSFETMGSISDCDKSAVIEMTDTVTEMILLSVQLTTIQKQGCSPKTI